MYSYSDSDIIIFFINCSNLQLLNAHFTRGVLNWIEVKNRFRCANRIKPNRNLCRRIKQQSLH